MGSPDLPPHRSVIDRLAKEAQRPDVHKYMSYKGEPILRKAFADWYGKWYRTELDYNSEVLPLIGSKEGIMHICMTFLDPGDKVLVPNPGYPTYSAAVRLAGGEMVTYALNKETNFYPDFEAIERAGLDGVKMMLVNYPNMPTGQTPTLELFQRIIDFGARHNILIVHDNPYSFIRNAAHPISIMEADGAREVALEMNSLSKGDGEQRDLAVEGDELLDDEFADVAAAAAAPVFPGVFQFVGGAHQRLPFARGGHQRLDDARETDPFGGGFQFVERLGVEVFRCFQPQLFGGQVADRLAVHREVDCTRARHDLDAPLLAGVEPFGTDRLDFPYSS